MYLKRITIVGFKSFANKTVLDLERGMTAVVGPNGSGKSNVADAIRWALGEQSKSRLRLGDREEVVFAGSDKRPRASLAEVVLLFDNEAGTFPLDLTEVEISRRLYRSGETEYRLAGRAVKLGDLQQLLAEAGFGVGSYAVVGQGMIDSLLLSSPTERKLLFDEAAGIRGAELSREASQRKLAATEANLVRLRDIAAELAPRAASLERAKAAAADEAKLAARVTSLKAAIIGTAEAELSRELSSTMHELTTSKRAHHRAVHELSALAKRQVRQLATAARTAERAAEAQTAISHLEQARDAAARDLGAAEVTLEQAGVTSQSVTTVNQRLKVSRATLTELETTAADTLDELQANQAAAKRAATTIEAAATLVKAAQTELMEVRRQLSDGTRQQYVGHALELVKTMAYHLNTPDLDREELRLLIHKTGRLLSHASRTGEAELATQLKAAQAKLELAMSKRDTATEHQTNITLSRRSLELEQSRQTAEVSAHTKELDQTRSELAQIEATHAKLADYQIVMTEARDHLRTVTAELDQARQTTVTEANGTSSNEVAALAVSLERMRAQAMQLAAYVRELEGTQAALAARRRHYRTLAAAWKVTAATPDDRTSLADQEALLVRLEGELAARTALGRELATEYDDVTTRQSELVTQIADLEAAKTDLETLVAKLAEVVRERFTTNFERLSQEFSRQVARLFDGGSAGLSLVEDESGQYGIQIKLSPKGKRLSSLAALSGGERAMAGVALLAAILTVNPSPFIVLDEIDAALDDANSGRLSDIMTELAATSQLIVITHNRQTMQAARVLFGVTMNDHHVSHLLSLHLEQAAQMAAR